MKEDNTVRAVRNFKWATTEFRRLICESFFAHRRTRVHSLPIMSAPSGSRQSALPAAGNKRFGSNNRGGGFSNYNNRQSSFQGTNVNANHTGFNAVNSQTTGFHGNPSGQNSDRNYSNSNRKVQTVHTAQLLPHIGKIISCQMLNTGNASDPLAITGRLYTVDTGSRCAVLLTSHNASRPDEFDIQIVFVQQVTSFKVLQSSDSSFSTYSSIPMPAVPADPPQGSDQSQTQLRPMTDRVPE